MSSPKGVHPFPFTEVETGWLASRDPALGEAIERVGHIERMVNPDIFSSLASSIVGQQISNAALATVWGRMEGLLVDVTPQRVVEVGEQGLRSCGMSGRKAGFIEGVAEEIVSGRFDVEALRDATDEDAIARLTQLRGVGRWTAEMLLIFCLERPDVVAYDDLALRRGVRMLYHHRACNQAKFESHRKRYRPYGTVLRLTPPSSTHLTRGSMP